MSLLPSALFCVENGLYIFPCRNKDGKPYLDKKGKWKTPKAKSPITTNGWEDASNDKKQIGDWWTKHPESAIGVSCTYSKLAVIDIDMKGSNGKSNYHKLGISDEDCWHNMTPNNGFHIIFSDPNGICPSPTNEKLGIDLRGVGTYFIIGPSYLYDENGNKKSYLFLDDLTVKPKEITIDIVKKFEKEKTQKKSHYIDTMTKSEKKDKIIQLLQNITFDDLDNYSTWLGIGMALKYELGDEGFLLWEDVTQKYFEVKPHSKRVNTLEYTWEHIMNDKSNLITGGSIWHYAKKKKEEIEL